MRVLFSCGDYYPSLGGATSLVDDLAGALLELGHEVTVVSRQWPGMSAGEMRRGYEIIRLAYPLDYEKFDFSEAFLEQSGEMLERIGRVLTERRIETVCLGLLDMSAVYFLLLRRMVPFRLVVYLHGGDVRKLPRAEGSYARLLASALRAADRVVAVSGDIAREAETWCPGAGAKIRVIPNGIDLRPLRSVAPRQNGREYIAFVGRLVWEKDAGTLILAFGAAQEEIGPVDLVMAGTGPEEGRLRELARGCPYPERICFLGRTEREEALAVIAGALFVVLPSVTEGFPIVAVEALAAGKPVVGSRVTGTAGLIANGVNGALFEPGDVAGLTALIRRYVGDRTALEGLAAGARATERSGFDIGVLVQEHLRAYGAGQ